jgi:hypothetical protein
MIKRILIAGIMSFLAMTAALATCTGPAVIKDTNGTSFNFSLSQNADGNCQYNILGYAGGFNVSIPFTPTVQNAAYAASNAMGALQTLPVFRTTAQPSGQFNNLMMTSKAGNVVAMTVYVFDTNPTASTCTDKTAFVLNSADIAKLAFAPFVVTPGVPQGATASAADYAVNRSVKNQDGTPTTNLYVCIVANAAVTPGSTTDLVFKINLAQD